MPCGVDPLRGPQQVAMHDEREQQVMVLPFIFTSIATRNNTGAAGIESLGIVGVNLKDG